MTKDDIGVGHRRLGPSLAIAGRTWISARPPPRSNTPASSPVSPETRTSGGIAGRPSPPRTLVSSAGPSLQAHPAPWLSEVSGGVIIGGSYVGLEFAQMYRRFGSAVTVIEMQPRLIAREDEDVAAAVAEILEQEGIDIRLDARCISAARHDKGISVAVECAEGPPKVTGSHLLLAVGRRPNTDDLGLDKAGVRIDERDYIQVDDQLRTNVPGIWALGDCNGRGAFTHTAYNDFEIVAANVLDNDRRSIADRVTAYALYIDPPLGRAGMTERQVRERKEPALIAKRPMTKVSRAVEKGETQGFMKILVDAGDKRILGASILGVGGDEVIHCILDLMYAKAPCTVLQRAMHIHPTVSELLPTMMGELKPLAPTESSPKPAKAAAK